MLYDLISCVMYTTHLLERNQIRVLVWRQRKYSTADSTIDSTGAKSSIQNYNRTTAMKYSNITAKYISTSYGQQTNSSKQLTVDSMQDCIARNHPLRRKISGPSVKETKDFGLCAASWCYCSEASETRGHLPPMHWYIYPRETIVAVQQKDGLMVHPQLLVCWLVAVESKPQLEVHHPHLPRVGFCYSFKQCHLSAPFQSSRLLSIRENSTNLCV